MKNSIEALVFLAKRESGLPRYHERLMFVAALYSAGASVVNIGVDDEARFPSDGVTIHIGANRASTIAIEGVIREAAKLRIVKEDIRQRGNAVRVYWA